MGDKTRIGEEINKLMSKFDDWGMLKDLTKHEQEQVFSDLKLLVISAISESHISILGAFADVSNMVKGIKRDMSKPNPNKGE